MNDREKLAALLRNCPYISANAVPGRIKEWYGLAAEHLLARGVSLGGASSPVSTGLTTIQELAQAAQAYLDAEIHVGVPEETLRRLNHRLGSLAGPHLIAYQAVSTGESAAAGSSE